jgi:hypothetical protein
MAQLPAMAIMDFVQRFQALQVQRDTGDELIKVGPAPAPPVSSGHHPGAAVGSCRDFSRTY